MSAHAETVRGGGERETIETNIPGAAVDREIDAIVAALEDGPLTGLELARRLNARRWGPGRFGNALRETIAEGRIERVVRSRYALSSRS